MTDTSASYPQGLFSWADLALPDPAAGSQFYAGLFGWEAEDQKGPDDEYIYTMFRSDGKEWGTAVIARRIEDGRSAIYTAKYMVILRGREKGHGKVDVSEVGSSSTDIMEGVLRGVQERTDDSDPPAEINPQLWFGEDGDESSSQD